MEPIKVEMEAFKKWSEKMEVTVESDMDPEMLSEAKDFVIDAIDKCLMTGLQQFEQAC